MKIARMPRSRALFVLALSAFAGVGITATLASADAPVNVSSPSSDIRLRPSRSAARPAATRNAAKTML